LVIGTKFNSKGLVSIVTLPTVHHTNVTILVRKANSSWKCVELCHI